MSQHGPICVGLTMFDHILIWKRIVPFSASWCVAEGLLWRINSAIQSSKRVLHYLRLKTNLDLFPREQIKIYIFEAFKKNAVSIILNLYIFLELT